MKALISFSIFLSVALSALAHQDSRQTADELFAQREFTEAGAAKAMDAADMYTRLAENAPTKEKNALWISAAKAYYFVGTYKTAKEDKIALFQKGMDSANNVLKNYLPEVTDENLEIVAKDVLAKTEPNEVLELAYALYYEGINLGSWAEANGISQSLSKWPTLRNYMLLIGLLGHKAINHYGASRVLGRAYYRLPVLAGGDKEKARQYLSEAFANTLNKAGGVSVNGNTNIFYAELLRSDKKEAEAFALLKAFIATPAEQLDPEAIPENKLAQETAKKLLADWEE